MTDDRCKPIGPDWFGPMDVEDWLKQWVPRIPKAKKQPFAGLPDHWEDSQVNQFVSVIRKSGLCKSIFPHATFDRCETDPDPYWDGRGIPCPSIVFSAEDDLLDGDPDSRLSASASCEMFFDINVLSDPDDGDSWYLNADPFDNVRGDWRGNASLGRLDMLANHANMVLNVGHRTHCFAAMIADDVARLVRFDRSGGVYSDLFDWRRTPTLANFIRAFDKMTSEERGWDTSVVRLAKDSPEVSQAWDIARREADNVLPRYVALRKVIPDPKNETRYLHLVHVYDESTAGTHRLVIGNPLACSDSLASHGTRGYFAVDLDEGTIVFLKDTWRLAMDPYLKESETYEKLIAHGVPHLPGYMIGGDVPVDWRNASDPGRDHEEPVQFQCTNNYDVWADADEKRRAKTGEKPPAETEMVLKPQRHHRIVLRKIGASIEHFKSTKELVGVVRDALEALHHSAKDVKIVHRDLSQGNVMIDKDGRGMLIDWDLAVPYTDDESSVKARQDIQGTWNFMSVNNIMSKGQEVRAHVAADDMEALFHVFCFTALACKMPPFNAFKPGPHGWRPMIARTWSSDGGLLFHRIEFLEEGEANFFRKERLEETIRPEILVRLILELRAIFSAVSGLPPREKDVSSAQIAKERSAAEKILKDGQRLLAIFRKYLNSNKWGGWPEDDVSFKCPEPESSSEDEDEDADADKPPSALERRGEKRKVEAVSDTKDDSPRKRRKSVGKLKMTLRSRPADSSDSSDDS